MTRPTYLLDFVAQVVERLAPASVLDPFATSPLPLAAVAEAVPAARLVGVTADPAVSEIGLAIAPTVDWPLRDPLTVLESAESEPVDLVLLSPPLSMRLPAELAEQAPPPAHRDVADYLLLHTLRQVGPTGRVLYHCADKLFRERGLLDACAAAGFNLTAVISVDQGFGSATGLHSSLALLERQPVDQLFVGRLDARTPLPELINNLLRRRPNRANFHLGTLTTFDYSGWGSFVLQREVADAFGVEHLRSISDIGSVQTLNLRPAQPYEAAPNTVYVPTLGAGEVRTVLPEIEGKRVYRLIEVQLDPSQAQAEYVAALLSSPAGRRLRASVATGTTIPNVKADALAGLRIPVPPVAVQEQAINASRHLASMEAEVARLRSDLWRHPEQSARVMGRLESAAKPESTGR